jgi:hypothetical protein
MRWTGTSNVNGIIAQGYPYELVGIVYYVFFLFMGRKRFAANYSNRSRYLALLAAIVMVGCVPFGYAARAVGIAAMVTIAVVALVSTFADGLADHRRKP